MHVRQFFTSGLHGRDPSLRVIVIKVLHFDDLEAIYMPVI